MGSGPPTIFFTLIFVYQFLYVTPYCVDYTYGFKEKCYAFLRPLHVHAMLKHVLNDENVKQYDPQNPVTINNQSAAKEICDFIGFMWWSNADTKIQAHAQEWKELGAFRTLWGAADKHWPLKHTVQLVSPSSEEEIEWLMIKAYQVYNDGRGPNIYLSDTRLGGSSFTLATRATRGVKLGTRPQYNVNNKSDVGILIYDPGRPDFQGLVAADPNNPYNGSVDKSTRVICEYQALPDCGLKGAPGYEHCTLNMQTGKCWWFDYYVRVPGHIRSPCKPITNRDSECPDFMPKKCGCKLSEWKRQVPCAGCFSKSRWGRDLLGWDADGDDACPASAPIEWRWDCPC